MFLQQLVADYYFIIVQCEITIFGKKVGPFSSKEDAGKLSLTG